MNRTTSVVSYTSARDADPPTRLVEFVNWICHELASIPEQHREAATIEIEAATEYGDCTRLIVISYSRPMTKNEAVHAAIDERADAALELARLRERVAQLEEKLK